MVLNRLDSIKVPVNFGCEQGQISNRSKENLIDQASESHLAGSTFCGSASYLSCQAWKSKTGRSHKNKPLHNDDREARNQVGDENELVRT